MRSHSPSNQDEFDLDAFMESLFGSVGLPAATLVDSAPFKLEPYQPLKFENIQVNPAFEPIKPAETCDCPPGECAGETFIPYEVGVSDVIDNDKLYAEDRAIAAGLTHAAAQFGEALASIARIAERVTE